MTLAEKIKELAKESGEIYSIVGAVKGVDDAERTCEVEPINGDATIYRVKLQGNQNGDNGLVVFPKTDSQVIVTFLNDTTGYVAMTTEIDRIELVIGNQNLLLDKDGLQFNGEGQNLLSLISELITILKNFQLSTNVGATIAVMPHISAQLAALETKFGKILK